MAEIKNQFKVYDNGEWNVLHSETAADVVKYSDTTVAGVLDNLGTTYVAKVAGKDLSSNDFTNAYKAEIDNLGTIYAKKSDVASALKYRGTVTNFASIPTDTSVGDVWNISVAGGADSHGIAIKAGDNVAKTETGYDVLAGAEDLSGYVEKVAGKDLSSNDFTNADKAKLASIDTDTFVQKVTGKDLSTNDFTNAYKDKVDNAMSFYIGTTAPTSTNTIWLEPIA